MDFLFIFAGVVLCVLFFLNIKSAADILVRIVGGFFFLILYNSVAPMLSLFSIGTNLITATICGTLGFFGFLLILLLNILF